MGQDQSQWSPTNDSLKFAGTPMAESCHIFIPLERSRVRTARRLLFSLLWDRRTSRVNFQEVINHLKAIFARHGIPETVISDNGPQYSSADFSKFAHEWGFTHAIAVPNIWKVKQNRRGQYIIWWRTFLLEQKIHAKHWWLTEPVR